MDAGFVAEGGAFVVGRGGVVFTTRSCLLNRNRNPQLNEADIDRELMRLGAKEVIWLNGDPDEPITSGHVDGDLLQLNPATLLSSAVKSTTPRVRARHADSVRLESMLATWIKPVAVS